MNQALEVTCARRRKVLLLLSNLPVSQRFLFIYVMIHVEISRDGQANHSVGQSRLSAAHTACRATGQILLGRPQSSPNRKVVLEEDANRHLHTRSVKSNIRWPWLPKMRRKRQQGDVILYDD